MHETFRQFISETVEPWLENCVSDGYTESFDGLRLHYHQAVHPEEKAAISHRGNALRAFKDKLIQYLSEHPEVQ